MKKAKQSPKLHDQTAPLPKDGKLGDMLYKALDGFTPDFIVDGREQPEEQERE